MTLYTPEYLAQNKALHALGGYGTSGHSWATDVAHVHRSIKAESALDYGAGQQTLSMALPDLNIRGYDPAIPEISEPPEPADLVICTDVLEHIEPECLDAVLDDLRRLTIRAVFLVIATRPAKKTLPDGRNAHLIQAKAIWWMPKLMSRWDFRQITDLHGGMAFMFFGKV